MCKTISARKEDYFEHHPWSLSEEVIDTTNHFEIGMVVQDSEGGATENAVVVNLPPIAAKDYTAYHKGEKEVSVAEDNPEYDPYASVVVVVFEDALREFYPNYTGVKPLPLDEIAEKGVEHYAFPPGRLRPVGDELVTKDSSKQESTIQSFGNTKQEYTAQPSDITEQEPNLKVESRDAEEVLSGEDSPNKYKADIEPPQDQSPSSVETHNVDQSEFKSKVDSTDSTEQNSSSGENNEVDQSEMEAGSNSATDQDVVDLKELREEAERNAVEDVPDNISTTTTEKAQYNRSSEVKKYVKARADGTCEGCGKPAPFTSKTGEPYLHAHHIYELSDGGSDTPDTVVALCPNCHYRVHHSEDGDEYNQELLEIVQEKENSNE